jgi:peptidoglycan/xylan/chitin deacetylase (PgdA/CDA1 family)
VNQKLTIVAYHYVRELNYSRYPEIKGLLRSKFKEQLQYLGKYYTFVTVDECLSFLNNENSLPSNSCLLTFDDGFIDHFLSVFPILHEKKIQGCFFPPAKAILSHEVLDVHKIHFILAVNHKKLDLLLKDVFYLIDKYRDQYLLEDKKHYFKKLAFKDPYDSPEVVFLKRLLQMELAEDVRKIITDELFQKFVTKDEKSFSKELYMDLEQLRCMCNNGMYIGSHGFGHYWLDKLSAKRQEEEINESLKFLELVNAPTQNWVMCYPFGAYNQTTIKILKKKSCAFALTTKVDIARFSKNNLYTLERLDTNDLPTLSSSKPNSWTEQILQNMS